MGLVQVFGNNVKKYRIERGYSQEHLAELCGLHRTYISAVERHKRSIALDNIQKISEALEIPAWHLLVEGENE